MNRREFLTTLLAGATLGQRAWAQAAERSPTERVPLGKTGLKASLVGLGTGMRGWMRQSNHTRMGQEAFTSLVRHAYDHGINLFDTADLYGSHTFLRDALKGIPRDQVVIQTKIWWQPKGLPEQVTDAKAAVERFRQELGTDYLDIVLLHCTTAASWPSDLRPMVDGLAEAKAKGLIRAHGASCHSLAALKASADSKWVDVQFARVNHKGTKMDGKPEEIAALLKAMRAHGPPAGRGAPYGDKAVIGMKIFSEGQFQTPEDREASLRFVLGQQCVDSMIIGFEKPEQIDETLRQMAAVRRA